MPARGLKVCALASSAGQPLALHGEQLVELLALDLRVQPHPQRQVVGELVRVVVVLPQPRELRPGEQALPVAGVESTAPPRSVKALV
jgi:hypothetical protein